MNPDDQAQDSPEAHDAQRGPDQDQPYVESSPTEPAAPIPTSVYCVQCGYNLTGVAIGSTCPECGRTVAPSFHGQMQPTSGMAIASMVLGIVSIVGCVMYGIPSLICGPLAIIFSRLAKKQISNGEAGGASAGMAITGFVCGIIGLMMAMAFAALIGFAIYSSP